MDSDLKIAAVRTKPMAIEEIGSDEERRTRLRRKKETLGMDDNVEVPGSEGTDARGSRDPVTHPQRTAPDLVLWSDEPGEYSNQLRRKGKPEERASQLVRIQRRRPTQASEIGVAVACEPEPRTIHITDNHTKSQNSRSSWRTTASCRMHLPVSCCPGHVGCCSRYDGSNQCGGKGASYIRSLGGGRTLASLGTEEGDLPHRR